MCVCVCVCLCLSVCLTTAAHHCARGHPANRIMMGHYHPARLLDPSSVPHILGLTASPIIRAKVLELR